MAHVLLFMSGRRKLRRAAVRGLAAQPGVFEQLLSIHVGGPSAHVTPIAAPDEACDPI